MRQLRVVVLGLVLAACGGGDDWLVDVTDSSNSPDDVATFPVDAGPELVADATPDAGPPPVLRALTVRWSFRTVDGEPKDCPPGTTTATFRAHVIDDIGVPENEASVIEQFACSDSQVAAVLLPAARYVVYVMFGDANGPNYGRTLAETVDLREANGLFEAVVIIDGGYFRLAWDLERLADGAKLTCDEATTVDHIAARAVSRPGGAVFETRLPCEQSDVLTLPLTLPLPAGEYDVAVSAIAADGKVLGTSKVTTAEIHAPNRDTIVDWLEIPIPAL